jgi:hypothetical protein
MDPSRRPLVASAPCSDPAQCRCAAGHGEVPVPRAKGDHRRGLRGRRAARRGAPEQIAVAFAQPEPIIAHVRRDAPREPWPDDGLRDVLRSVCKRPLQSDPLRWHERPGGQEVALEARNPEGEALLSLSRRSLITVRFQAKLNRQIDLRGFRHRMGGDPFGVTCDPLVLGGSRNMPGGARKSPVVGDPDLASGSVARRTRPG